MSEKKHCCVQVIEFYFKILDYLTCTEQCSLDLICSINSKDLAKEKKEKYQQLKLKLEESLNKSEKEKDNIQKNIDVLIFKISKLDIYAHEIKSFTFCFIEFQFAFLNLCLITFLTLVFLVMTLILFSCFETFCYFYSDCTVFTRMFWKNM